METKLGEAIKDLVCEDCKQKITYATSKLSKWDLLKPLKTAEKFRRLLCNECHKKVLAKYRGAK